MVGESPSKAEIGRIAYDAGITLLRMESHGVLAHDYDLAVNAIDRFALAASYKEVVGIHPEVRDEFRKALSIIRGYSDTPEVA